MEFEKSIDIEIQARESNASQETFNQPDALKDDWDAPDNKENPRNWSACE
jgi:hypothetical protein